MTELEYCSTAKFAYVALNALTRNRLPYGKLLPQKIVPARAIDTTECAICRDVLTTPVQLSCGHIFCDACLVDWLEVSVCQLKKAFLPNSLFTFEMIFT